MKRPIVGMLFLLISTVIFSQDHVYTIYHGSNGLSKVIEKNRNKIKLKANPGDEFELRVININPYFYKYEFKTDSSEFKVDTDLIESTFFNESSGMDLKDLLSSFGKSVPVTKTGGGSNSRTSGRRQSKISYFDDKVITDFIDHSTEIRESYKKVMGIVNESDSPKGINQINSLGKTSFTKAIDSLSKIKDLKNQLDLKYTQAIKNALLFDNDKTKNKSGHKYASTIVNLIKAYSDKVIQEIIQIKEIYKPNASALAIYNVTVKENQKLEIKLKCSKKSDTATRDVSDELITIIIEPKYKRNNLEFVPLASLAIANNIPQYSLNNGIIEQDLKTDMQVNPSFLLNYNFLNFGNYNRNAFGAGLGVSLSSEGTTLDNVFGSLMLSYTDNFRISLGYGWAQFGDGLTQENSVGSLATSELDKIIDYNSKGSIFLSFSIFGLDIPGL